MAAVSNASIVLYSRVLECIEGEEGVPISGDDEILLRKGAGEECVMKSSMEKKYR